MLRIAAGWLVVLCVLGAAPHGASAGEGTVSFADDIAPLLRRHCLECHGERVQEGGLRLDGRNAALAGGDSGAVIVPGRPDESELLRRVSLRAGDAEIMPARGKPLTPEAITLLRMWIAEGADWPETASAQRHWSYVVPNRPIPPTADWGHNAIDAFILAKLQQRGLSPAEDADRRRLIRRVTLDLTGLPPTPREVEAFVNDNRPNAYERVVERLLASEQFGVHWARSWLDCARYADSHGFQRDDLRDLWPYRDWVVDAINADMPFDQFTIEQLAGDLIPGASESQRIATGFNRSAPCNVEAGSEPEETRVNQVFDRVNTLGMVWLGTTLECCQCHDHKYDPFTMTDYYGLFAIFNDTEIEADRANPKVPGSIRFLGPQMEITDAETDARREMLASQIDDFDRRIAQREGELSVDDPEWEDKLRSLIADAAQEHRLTISRFVSQGGAEHEFLDDGSVLLSGPAPAKDTYEIEVATNLTGIRAFKLETLTDPSLPGQGPGRGDAQRPNFVLHDFTVTVAPPEGGEGQPVAFRSATADFSQKNYDVSGAIDDDAKSAWAINPKFHESHWAIFQTKEPIGDGEAASLTIRLAQNFGSARTIGRLRLSALTGNIDGTAVPAEIVRILNIPAAERSESERLDLGKFRGERDDALQRLREQKQELQQNLDAVKSPQSLVMRQVAEPRDSFIFERGDYRTPSEPVTPHTPAIFSASEEQADPATRLDLARWLASADNPLTARVTVNRWWSELFGQGLVTTPEDFGLKGEPPTHPELLDWLATELIASGWSRKHVLRTIVTSATYRQSSRISPELLAADDQNLLYARGPRVRLAAEAIRDNALAISGLISLDLGGPPIRPAQPDGLWKKVGGEQYDYIVSPRDQRYRRGLYVVWKRAAPYPSFVNFDANARLACRVSRTPSNTPLQALTLMNDPVYVAAAQAFAVRIMSESGTDAERIDYAFRVALSRPPTADESSTLSLLLESQRVASHANGRAAQQFLGERPLPDGYDAADFVSWYAVAAALLNLDETVTKG